MPISKRDRKARKKARGKPHPYGRDGMVEVHDESSEAEKAPKTPTRGHILQRYKFPGIPTIFLKWKPTL
jgi:hypothetical protein